MLNQGVQIDQFLVLQNHSLVTLVTIMVNVVSRRKITVLDFTHQLATVIAVASSEIPNLNL